MIFGVIKKVFWLLLIGSIVVAIVRGAGSTPAEWGAWLSEQHTKVDAWVDDLGGNITEVLPEVDGSTPGSGADGGSGNDGNPDEGSSDNPSDDTPQQEEPPARQ